MRIWTSLLCLALAACASAPPAVAPPEPAPLFHDALFAAPSEPIRAEDVFALSEGMKRYLANEIAAQLRVKGAQEGLIDALYSRNQLRLRYDTAATRNAAQAFDTRSGNCLSLVIMTAAFARELGLQIQYQSAYVDETWSRSNNIYFASGHVNLTLGKRLFDAGSRFDTGRLITIDFLPADEARRLRTRAISEATVIAMYMNNRSAEALVQERLDDAYAWARAAIEQSPTFLSAYNTLGVVYLRHGNLREAERILAAVIEREPDNTPALSNLALVLDRQGRVAEAALLQRRLAQIEPYPPFHFFDRGMAAMQAGDFKAARELFGKEVARAAYYHEFHFWLAVANFRLGDIAQARKHLTIAIENSTTARDHDLYAAKLGWINSERAR
ncbi:tetratricopeptide repeat protein [Piscinibacter sp.]|uniref:tetratricopeptide repeat protein n=1 Tax=Piscinibacter sp. TaxID=1903157 RepID=UPI002F3FD359